MPKKQTPVKATAPAESDDEDDFNESNEEIIIADFKVEHPHLKVIRVVDPSNPCTFCKTPKIDEIGLGPLYHANGKTTHYYCMLFAAGLSQSGVDKEGILGFLPADIDKEFRRAARLKCIFCHTGGAPVGCCDRRCKATFHFPCGRANKASFMFSGNYESYCVKHTPPESIPRSPEVDHQCSMCLCTVKPKQSHVSSTCCVGSIFHTRCIQRLAFSAGYFLKCPTCNAEEKFKQDMRVQGIFVPEQDASWEREPEAYQDMYKQYSKCDAKVCECPKGREHVANKGAFMLARCIDCGHAGIHRQCGKLKTASGWTCPGCVDFEMRREKKALATKQQEEKSEPVPENEVLEFIAPPIPPQKSAKTASKKAVSKKKNAVVDMDEEIPEPDQADVAKIFILPACSDFFPHNRVALQKYALRRTGLPDWRMQDLFINLVDMFGDTDGLLEVAKRLPDPPAATAVVPVLIQTTQTSSAQSENRRKSGDRRPYRKRTSWQKGVVKKRSKTPTTRRASKRSQGDVEETSTQDNHEEVSSHLNLTYEMEIAEPQPSTSSKAILEGIRRSQTTLLRLATNGVDVAVPAMPGPSSSNIQAEGDPEPPNKRRKLDDRLCEKGGTEKNNKGSSLDSIDSATNDPDGEIIQEKASSSDRAISSSSIDAHLNHNNSMRDAVEASHNATAVSQLLDPEKSKTVKNENDEQVTTETIQNGVDSPDQSLKTSADLETESMDVDSPNLV